MLKMYPVALQIDAEVGKIGDVVVTLKFSVLRDLQNAGAFLAERHLSPSLLHRSTVDLLYTAQPQICAYSEHST